MRILGAGIPLKKCTFLLLLGAVLSSCATMENSQETEDRVVQLTSEHKYQDARDFVNSKKNVERWCFEFYDNGICRMPLDASPVPEWSDGVAQAERCDQVLQKCSSTHLYEQDADLCLQNLEKECQFDNKKYKFASGRREQSTKLRKTIEDKNGSYPLAPVGNSAMAVEFTKKTNICKTGFKWGFYKSTAPNEGSAGNSRAITPTKLSGTFETEQDCNAARLNTDANLRGPDDECRS